MRNCYAEIRPRGGRPIVHVTLSCVHFKHDILAEVDVLEFETSCDANYYVRLVEGVIRDWNISRRDNIGISVDNTAVNPAFVRQMGLRLLPCVMHVVNLMLEAAFASFNADDLYGWASFFSHRHKLRAAALTHGIAYRKASTAGTRFGSKLPFLEELSKPGMFAKWSTFAKLHPPDNARGAASARRGRGRGRGGAAVVQAGGALADAARVAECTRYELLIANMEDNFTHASILVLHEMLCHLSPLLTAAQCSLRTIPFDFWMSWEAAETERVAWFNDPGVKLAALVSRHGIALDAEATSKLETAIVYAIEKMDDKINSHLMETVTEMPSDDDGDAGAVDYRKILQIFRRRELWDVTRSSTMVNATNAASVIAATGCYDSSFVTSYIRFRQLLDCESLGITVPQIPRSGHPEDNAKVVDFWIAALHHPNVDVRRVGEEACIACSFPLSEAVVERSFATLTNHQHESTLLAGNRYLRNLCMYTVNRSHLFEMYGPPMRELALKFGF